MGQKKLAVFMGERINKGFFTRKKIMAVLPGSRKSGRNNKVTVQGCCLRNVFGALWAPEMKS